MYTCQVEDNSCLVDAIIFLNNKRLALRANFLRSRPENQNKHKSFNFSWPIESMVSLCSIQNFIKIAPQMAESSGQKTFAKI